MASAKPIVGLNADFRQGNEQRASCSFLAAGYYDCISAAGGIPVILPPLREPGDITALVAKLDACVLIGGADLDPRRDGFMLHPTVSPHGPASRGL